ncbi:phosphate-selective porin O and P [Pseudopedobacter saltans DSM 12145]|uniref:Phosphate-selective porin O and P n=1 Tax=Pseudopedobacter saltans (strain ATCC 51119 / DSM 12145 / JCM 21818 / CCUG 39354 / LMG 10337 / NBRC 100064 / NCIMB 13643) TaxID=762903 RepID=F0S876_PSESL|nr:porin [Pseudopedobacter saltans]ADY52338.1 phosphate-selective porin O and P [Pseudopedobacter saltans DSM 12145]
MNKRIAIFFLTFATIFFSHAAFSETADSLKQNSLGNRKWFEVISLRGYGQVRYNRLLETNEKLGCDQCDKSWGNDGGLFIRRLRLVFYGWVNERIYFYVQPDFASSSGSTLNYLQLRDAFVDLGIDKENIFRVRIGQSKVPYGFENAQSSQNRLTIDRADGTNSAFVNERDLGVFIYWTPKIVQERFETISTLKLKGSGNFGMAGFGFFNGQGANKADLNKKQHIVGRFTYPLLFGKQFIEPGIQAYTGDFTMPSDLLSNGVKTNLDKTYKDERIGATLVIYPQPIGIQAEYNIGKGPQYNKQTDSIEVRNLKGGYITLNAKANIGKDLIYPYFKYNYYDGGKKFEKDARSYLVKEFETGIEWQPNKFLELVVAYTISDRTYEDFVLRNNRQKGNLLRIQAQFNF